MDGAQARRVAHVLKGAVAFVSIDQVFERDPRVDRVGKQAVGHDVVPAVAVDVHKAQAAVVVDGHGDGGIEFVIAHPDPAVLRDVGEEGGGGRHGGAGRARGWRCRVGRCRIDRRRCVGGCPIGRCRIDRRRCGGVGWGIIAAARATSECPEQSEAQQAQSQLLHGATTSMQQRTPPWVLGSVFFTLLASLVVLLPQFQLFWSDRPNLRFQ